MEFLKSIGGKIISGLVALAVFAVGLAWYRMAPGDRSAWASGAGRTLGWVLLVAALPWAAFFVIQRVDRLDNNAASGAFILLLTALEAAGLAWIFEFSIHGSPAWTFFTVGVVLSGVYNLLACDWIAEKMR